MNSSGQLGYPLTYGALGRSRRMEMLLTMSIGDSKGCCRAHAIFTGSVKPSGERHTHAIMRVCLTRGVLKVFG